MAKTRGGMTPKGGVMARREGSKRGGVTKQVGEGSQRGHGGATMIAEGGAVRGRRRKLPARRGRGNNRDVTLEDATMVEPDNGAIDEEVEGDDVMSDDNSSIDGDDCEVTVEDTAGYKESEAELNEETKGEKEEEEEFINVEICQNIEDHFGEEAREGADESDNDSGDDIWNDDNIHDPSNNSDDDLEGDPTPVVHPDELIGLVQSAQSA
ncbi:hypothetical protein AALP_AAs56901U000500 [Arabis alpina]|uniref:Uncharacterized protein n=1 Tax=Arabis alpina TaxID=50452 RepID=A0A087FWD5_ARAAL|nr:hypothetical protein AALP_AAs56901U000500 [Arabis alpina]